MFSFSKYFPPLTSLFFFSSTDQIFSFSRYSFSFFIYNKTIPSLFPCFSLFSADEIFSLFKYFPFPFVFPFVNQIFSSFSLTREGSSLTRPACHFWQCLPIFSTKMKNKLQPTRAPSSIYFKVKLLIASFFFILVYTENGEEKLRKHLRISWGVILGYLGITLRK